MRGSHSFLTGVAAVAALLAFCAVPAQATVPGTNGKIAFTSGSNTFGSGGDIHVANPDGTGEVNLTNNPASDRFPAWSPDGTKIAFVSDRELYPYDQYPDVWIMDADGSNLRRLTFRAG